MNKQDVNILVLPDIHGRRFWYDAINMFPKDEYPNLDIVFLGDYVDPYESLEHITRQEAIDNFKDILEYAKNDNRIKLLIGNHDMHYWYNAPYKSRVDYKNYDKIKDMFLQNFTLFNVAFEKIVNNEKFLFTHAGVTKQWFDHLRFIGKTAQIMHKDKLKDDQLEYCKFLENFEPDAIHLNKLKLNFQGQANLWMASYARGGDYNCGSCIWEDLTEWFYQGTEIGDMWQIFGHSRWSKDNPEEAYINKDKKIACVDTAYAWVITNDAQIKKLEEIEK